MNELTQRLDGLVQDDREAKAREVAKAELHGHEVGEVVVNDDTVTVHAGPFTGYHALRRDVDGGRSASTLGSYVHDPSGVEFEAECPSPDTLHSHVERAVSGPSPRDAAVSTYRRTRL